MPRQRGQILVLFTLSLAAILAFGALLIDGAQALVVRRSLQNAADAAALAGANVLQAANSSRFCTVDGHVGPPRADIVNAAVASVTQNVPGYDPANVAVTCAGGFDNQAVRVELNQQPPNILAQLVLGTRLNVATTSTAVNGQITGSVYSIITLNPWRPDFSQQRDGCPSVLLSGGPTITMHGSIMINSACPAGSGGAFGTNGNAATFTALNESRIRTAGGYNATALTLNPAPITGQRPVADPLAHLDPASFASLPVRSTSRLVLSNVTQVLQPGIYVGGIQLRNSSIALLRPGIYVLQGGGLAIGAQATVCSISSTSNATDCSNWEANCPDISCGVLLHNAGTASGSTAMGPISVSAGASLRLRPYDERANGGAEPQFRNVLLWQNSTPVPTAAYAQPVLALSGGGSVNISGTVYAPSAKVNMGGGAGGSGGNTALTVQFVAWDLELSGNSSFTFYFSEDDFARPTDYGLIQ